MSSVSPFSSLSVLLLSPTLSFIAFRLETFLHYLHDVFKGDVQISAKDDWVFGDVELLRVVVTPAMRVALKLYQVS